MSDHEICTTVLDLVDHLDAMVAYWDSNRVCRFANDAYRNWFGKRKEEVVGMTMQGLLGELYAKNLPYIDAAFAGAVQVFEREIRAPDGRVRHSLATYTPRIVDGKVAGIFAHVADVTPLKKLEQELKTAIAKAEHLAIHDFLTGLPNRVTLHERLSQAVAAARRRRDLVGVISLDVDDFKRVNDTYGHDCGDQMLVEIAARLKLSLREADTATRMGGDEFLLLAPDIESDAQLERIAQRLMEEVRKPMRLQEHQMTPSISMGIAVFPSDGGSPEELIASADRALYTAKRSGKGRYSFAEKLSAPSTSEGHATIAAQLFTNDRLHTKEKDEPQDTEVEQGGSHERIQSRSDRS
jgi:diguanylate cyclase (GGDEF)-like protein/PAS domain S-box-containing protein